MATWNNLDPLFVARMEAALQAAEAATGGRRQILSGYRDPKEQAQLYANWIHQPINYQGVTYSPNAVGGRAAAPPGYNGAQGSMHQRGMALDLAPGPVRDWIRAHAGQFGLETLNVNDDLNHIQLARSINSTVYDHGVLSQGVALPSTAGALAGATSPFVMPPNAPIGMRNNNPFDIKYYAGAPYAGLIGPSVETDQGDPQMKFATPEHGIAAGYQLLLKKYQAGKITPAQIIAGQGGWTPGNMTAAERVAANAGIGVNEDIRFTDPARAKAFMRGLMGQELGPNPAKAYSDAMIENAIAGKTPNTGPNQLVPGTSEVIPREQLSGGGQAAAPATANTSAAAPASGSGTAPPPDIPDLASLFGGIGGGGGYSGGYDMGYSGGIQPSMLDYTKLPLIEPEVQPASASAETLSAPWVASQAARAAPPELSNLFTLKTIGMPASRMKAMQLQASGGLPTMPLLPS